MIVGRKYITDHNLINLFQINNANRRQILWKLRIPSAMPFVVTGLRISAGLSVIGESCCSPAAESNPIHGGLSDLLKKYDINDFAAGVQVYAVKPL